MWTHALVIAASLLGLAAEERRPEVRVAQGVLSGEVRTSPVTNKTIISFRGIPYAKPPIADLRFKAPEPPEPWSGVRNATRDGTQCMQWDDAVVGDENCLFLSVFTPKLPTARGAVLRPVMVWIPGGSFLIGNGTQYGPDYFLAENVVLVGMNYRLGALGFLSLNNSDVSGNMGLKDQVAAMRWVKENIAAFGGDPNKVTIFGESAGAVSVHIHMLSPLTKGLFHRAIAQSGVAFGPASWKESHSDEARRLATLVGCNETDEGALAQCLRKVPAARLVVETLNSVAREDLLLGIYTAFRPTVDGSYLPQDPAQILEAGSYQRVPFLAGANTAEGLITFPGIVDNQTVMDELNARFDVYVPRDLNLRPNSSDFIRVREMIRDFYFQGGPISNNTVYQYRDLSTDILLLVGLHRTLRIFAKYPKHLLYLYQMAYEGPLGFMKILYELTQYKGVCHADDLGYMWYIGIQLPDTHPATITRKRIVSMWTNFAKTGNPTPRSTALLPDRWRPFSAADPAYLLIGEDLRVARSIENKRMDFWDEIYTTRDPLDCWISNLFSLFGFIDILFHNLSW